MGEIVSFKRHRSTRNVMTFRTKLNKKGNNLLAYRNNPERWRPSEERTRLTNMDEITPSIDYAIGRFRWCVEQLAKEGELDYEMFEQDFPKLRKKNGELNFEASCAISQLDLRVQAEIAFEMLEAIHDGWVNDLGEDFFGLFMDREYFFLPIELIGVGRLGPYFKALEPHLLSFGLEAVKWDQIVEIYNQRRIKFVKKYGIKKPNDLTNAIVSLASTYHSLRPKVKEAMKERRMAFDIARQVSARSPELFRIAKAV